jgi:hypothetical protein
LQALKENEGKTPKRFVLIFRASDNLFKAE